MSNLPVSFNKAIISNKHSNDIYSKGFEKILKTEEHIDEEKVKEIYDEIFYHFRRKGKHSHEKIHRQSFEHIYAALNRRLDNEINQLIGYVAEKDQEFDHKNHLLSQHPIWEEGALIMIGGNGVPSMGHENDLYIIQEGRQREIAPEMEILVRRARGLPEAVDDQYVGVYFISIHEFNQIPDGPPIGNESDLNLKGAQLITDLGDLLGVSAHVTASIHCRGNEIQDVFNLILGDDEAAEGQFYLNNEGCNFKYIKDQYINDEISYVIKNLDIPKGDTVYVPILRRTISGMEGAHAENFPSNLASIYDNYLHGQMEYNGNTINNYIKNWGANSQYEGIVYATGRLEIQEIHSPYIPLQDTGKKTLNGLPTSGSGFWDVVEMPEDFGEEITWRGTRRLYMPGSGYYGGLNQNTDLQEDFNDVNDFRYYRPYKSLNYDLKDEILDWVESEWGDTVRWVVDKILSSTSVFANLPVYGQPIIRFDNKDNVILDIRSWGITLPDWGILGDLGGMRLAHEWFITYDLHSGDVDKISKNRMKNRDVHLEMDDGHIQRIKWENIPDSRIKFIGLRGNPTLGYYSDGIGNDNPYNSSQWGSNYEWTGNIPNYVYT